MIVDCPSWLSLYRILELAMREFEALEENRLFVKGEHLERMNGWALHAWLVENIRFTQIPHTIIDWVDHRW
jgi:hypothetical protein